MVYKSGQIFLPFCHNIRVWQIDRRTDGRTEFSSLDRVCISCSAVITMWMVVLRCRFRRCGVEAYLFYYAFRCWMNCFSVGLQRKTISWGLHQGAGTGAFFGDKLHHSDSLNGGWCSCRRLVEISRPNRLMLEQLVQRKPEENVITFECLQVALLLNDSSCKCQWKGHCNSVTFWNCLTGLYIINSVTNIRLLVGGWR